MVLLDLLDLQKGLLKSTKDLLRVTEVFDRILIAFQVDLVVPGSHLPADSRSKLMDWEGVRVIWRKYRRQGNYWTT